MTNSEARKRAQAAASQVQGAAEVGADAHTHGGTDAPECTTCQRRDPGECTLAALLRHQFSYLMSRHGAERVARAIIAAGWVPPERVAEARAEGVVKAIYEGGLWCGECDSTDPDDDCCVVAERIRDVIKAGRIAERGDS